MATRVCSLSQSTLYLQARTLFVCGMLLIDLWCCCPLALGQELEARDEAPSPLGVAGLHLPPEPTLAAPTHGDVPPRPAHAPAPLDFRSAGLDAIAPHGDSIEPDHTQKRPNQPVDGQARPKTGEVETIRERYPNRSVKIEREVTQDQDGNYVNHGSWKMWDERGNLVAEGRYDMGAKTGRWTRWHRRGDSPLFNASPFSQAQSPYLSQATFDKDMLHGDWIIYDSKQHKLSHITFAEGQRHGPATLWLPTGQVVRQTNYSHGDLDGDVMELSKDGKLTKTAVYQQGRRIAQKTTYFTRSRNPQTEAVYLFAKLVPKTLDSFWEARFAEYEPVGQDERHGKWTTWYENGQIQVQGQYRYDQPVGQFTWWHPNGQKYAEGQYVDGRQNGVWQWWHRNGQKWTEGEYRHGEQTGQWSSWTESGRLDQQATYSGSRPQPSTAAVEKEKSPQSSRRLK